MNSNKNFHISNAPLDAYGSNRRCKSKTELNLCKQHLIQPKLHEPVMLLVAMALATQTNHFVSKKFAGINSA